MSDELPDSVYGKRARRRSRTVVKVILSTLLALGLVAGGGAVVVYRHLNHNIRQVEPPIAGPDPIETQHADDSHEPLNILVMGSDSRDCKGCHLDSELPGGSDTTILFHLSADRKRAYGISIPRDSMVDRPECKKQDGTLVPGSDYEQWNAAFAVAGPGCTLEQFYADTGIKLNHFVVVDFEGFKDMVDAVGGVEVCTPNEIDDTDHGIVIPAGRHRIRGQAALSYVRERYDVGDGSDLGRIQRQQAFIASMVASVMSSRTLTNPIRLIKFLDAATKSLEVDKGTSLARLAELGADFHSIGLDHVQFLTVPVEADPRAPLARVVWTSQAQTIWNRVKADRPIPRSLTGDAIKVSHVPGSGPTTGPTSGSTSGTGSSAQEHHDAVLTHNGLCT